jgi:hypothetical protein
VIVASLVTAASFHQPAQITVQSGETLSSITTAACGPDASWEATWAANSKQVANPNLIYPGEALTVPCGAVQSAQQPITPVSRPAVLAAAPQGASGYSTYGTVNPADYSGIESCIISRESGGNSQVMNASGHYGLFQFDYGTWVSGGGAPGDFGHAPVAEQERVFSSVYAARGAEPWAPSDGC